MKTTEPDLRTNSEMMADWGDRVERNIASNAAFYETRQWLDLRYRVLRKRGGCCEACGFRGSQTNPIQVDHIKPRSKYPDLQLVESNLQVLCRDCNLGKSNKDETNWGLMPSREFQILQGADPTTKAKLQQLGWLMINGNDTHMKREAERQYKQLWRELENEWKLSGRD